MLSARPRDERTLALRTPTETLVIERDAVRRSRLSALSLMPEGLLETLGDDEVRDLIAFLMARPAAAE